MNKLVLLAVLIAVAFSAEQLNKINNITKSMGDFVGQTLDFEYYTGYIPVGDAGQENTSLFFTLTTKQGETIDKMSPDTPVIFWFNGGPGCSSDFGNWLEIGPFQLDSDLNPSVREYSWNKQALLVFTDQPINTGFSYSADSSVQVSDTVQAAEYFKKFFIGFYENFPTLKSNPTYFFGESYAGHYIPCFAKMVVEEKPVEDLNFMGVGIGDGWTDPEFQMPSLSNFFFNTAVAGQGQREEMAKKEAQGVADIAAGNYADATHIFDSITDETEQYGNIDQYNFFYYNANGQEDPYTQQYFVELFNEDSFREIYQIPDIIPKFANCNDDIYVAFNDDFTKSYKSYVEWLLQEDVRVLLFNGQLDIIVNAAGAQDWINTMQWKHINEWKYTTKTIWRYEPTSPQVFGNYQQVQNFCYANIYLAGHMVPSDQPQAAYTMLETYLDWNW